MKKYFFSELYPFARHSAGIWREDVEEMLEEAGFSKIDPKPAQTLINRMLQYFTLFLKIRKLPSCSLFFFHFPLRSRLIRFLLYLIRQRNGKSIALIHDIEGLRDENKRQLDLELKYLAKFTVVLAQNNRMKQWLEERIDSKIISLDFHDGLYGKEGLTPARKKAQEVAFAGNLQKALFVKKLQEIEHVRFHIYGAMDEQNRWENVHFNGIVDPVELGHRMKGSFGLVWDGDSICSCSNGFGRYLLYNTPYKMTAYVLAGLPFIVWDKSAMAAWVQANNLGVAVSSLYELDRVIESITEDQYEDMKNKIALLKKKISKGYFFKNALERAEALVRC